MSGESGPVSGLSRPAALSKNSDRRGPDPRDAFRAPLPHQPQLLPMRSERGRRPTFAARPSCSPGGSGGLVGFPVQTIAVVLLLGLWTVGLSGALHAQETDSLASGPPAQMYRVETTGGEVLIGTTVSETEAEVVLDTRRVGTVTLERTEIERIDALDPTRFRDGEYWFRNPQSTRYLFAPNALGIPKGEGYYQNTWILLNNVNYGVSDHFSIGGGTVPIFLFGADAIPVWVLPKVSVSAPRNNLHLAGGAVLGGVVGETSEGVGLLYGAATIGDRDHNATLGLGYGYTNGEVASTPAINLSGMLRVSPTVYLLTENYIVPAEETGTIASVGVRWAPRDFAVDFALARPLGEDTGGLIGIPWLGVTIPFGR